MAAQKPLAEFVPGPYQGATYRMVLFPDRLVYHARQKGQDFEQNYELRSLSPYCDRGTFYFRDYSSAAAMGIFVGLMTYLFLEYAPRAKEGDRVVWVCVSLFIAMLAATLTLFFKRRGTTMAAFKNTEGHVLCSVVLTKENATAFEEFHKVFAEQVKKVRAAGDKASS